jgi:hypothetical protein
MKNPYFYVNAKQSYVSVAEKQTYHGIKQEKAKDHVTLFVCTIGDGRNKIPFSIAPAKEPMCFKKKEVPVKYARVKPGAMDRCFNNG